MNWASKRRLSTSMSLESTDLAARPAKRDAGIHVREAYAATVEKFSVDGIGLPSRSLRFWVSAGERRTRVVQRWQR